MLPYWYKAGREFAFDVLAGPGDAGMFLPERAMREWFDFNVGSGFDSDELMEMARWALTIPAARRDFARGYRDGMRETRTSRRAAKHAAGEQK